MTFWCGSGSADPCLRLIDPDPSTFIIDLQDANKKVTLKKVVLHITLWRSQSSRNQGFSYYFCLMIEESGSGSIPLTNGSGSRRPKNTWIRLIRIRIRTRTLRGGQFPGWPGSVFVDLIYWNWIRRLGFCCIRIWFTNRIFIGHWNLYKKTCFYKVIGNKICYCSQKLRIRFVALKRFLYLDPEQIIKPQKGFSRNKDSHFINNLIWQKLLDPFLLATRVFRFRIPNLLT